MVVPDTLRDCCWPKKWPGLLGAGPVIAEPCISTDRAGRSLPTSIGENGYGFHGVGADEDLVPSIDPWGRAGGLTSLSVPSAVGAEGPEAGIDIFGGLATGFRGIVDPSGVDGVQTPPSPKGVSGYAPGSPKSYWLVRLETLCNGCSVHVAEGEIFLL